MPNSSDTAPAMLANLGTVKVPKSCDVLSERLQQQILSGAFPPGSALPTERELVAGTGLSRGSVREALRILEAKGLVETRAGRYGGSFVAQPTDAQLIDHIHLFARGRSIPLSALVEARHAVGPRVAFLAARNRTAEDLDALHQISARLEEAAVDDVPRFLEENANWHSAIAVASHNDLLRAFASSISGLMLEASRIENFASDDIRTLVTHAHRKILQAIEAQDAETARRRAEKDIEAYARYLEAALKTAGRAPA